MPKGKELLQEYREAVDCVMWFENWVTISAERTRELFEDAWLSGFLWLAVVTRLFQWWGSQRMMNDWWKLLLQMCQTNDLPLQIKLIFPEESWVYKFVVYWWSTIWYYTKELRGELITGSNPKPNEIVFEASVLKDHWSIVKVAGIWFWQDVWFFDEWNVFWWWWVDVDHSLKTIKVYWESSTFWPCSNEVVQRLLRKYMDQWYTIVTDLDNQWRF